MLFEQGYSCSQSVFAAFAPDGGLTADTALRIAGGLGGGMGRLGEVCGAVTGAILAIGLAHGATRPDDDAAKEATYTLVNELAGRFRRRNGSVLCRELLGMSIDSADLLQRARDEGVFGSTCPGLVRAAAEIVVEHLADA
jgi:C_GCAxxG_C_C family probable redox protein